MTNATILISGFICSMIFAYWHKNKYDAQVKLNDELISIVRKQTAQIDEYKDALGK